MIHCGEHFQPLLNLMRDDLFACLVIHCDGTNVQALKEPDREPSSQSLMRVQTVGSPYKEVVRIDCDGRRAKEVTTLLLDGYRS